MRLELALSALLLLAAAPFAWAQQDQQPAHDPKAEALRTMRWVGEGDLRLASSASTLKVPAGFHAVAGGDAAKLSEYVNGAGDPDLEGVVVGRDGSMVYMDYIDSGYVSVSDWSDLDADALIKEVRDNTETANAQRTAKGLPALHVDGWLEKPALDRTKNQVHWSFTAHDEHGAQLVNAIALQLGRTGYEKLIWAGDPATYQKSQSLGLIADSRTFDPGKGYADHVDSDRTAEYGIAGLVGAIAGAKLLKVAAGAGLLVLMKKFIIVPLALAVGAVKRFFSRRKAATAAAVPTPMDMPGPS